MTVALAIVLVIASWIFLRYRAAGRSLYAIGGSAEVARLAGIRVRHVTSWVYVASGLLSGLAGIVLASRLDSSQPSAGLGYELDAIAAVVIGGASLSGGVGGIGGTVVGVLIIGVLEWSDRGLRVNSISPGYTATPMNLRPEVAEQVKQFEADTPLGRMATVDELVGPAIFLSSQAASFCTGIDLVVDGGFVCW